MIFYFSGTGNSLHAAQTAAHTLDEPLCDMASILQQKETTFSYTPKTNEKIGFIFPVYAWGIPKPVLSFLQKLELSVPMSCYIFAIVTCGENVGTTMTVLQKILKKKGIPLHSGFTLPMPDNYVVLFDVAPKEEQQKKIEQSNLLLKKILHMVALEKENFFRVEKGSFPWLKSTVFHFFFHKFYTNTKRFYTTGDCIGCGLCEKQCPGHFIHMKGERPTWETGTCYMCLSCLNHCPKEAIQYTKQTEKHGRYTYPTE